MFQFMILNDLSLLTYVLWGANTTVPVQRPILLAHTYVCVLMHMHARISHHSIRTDMQGQWSIEFPVSLHSTAVEKCIVPIVGTGTFYVRIAGKDRCYMMEYSAIY